MAKPACKFGASQHPAVLFPLLLSVKSILSFVFPRMDISGLDKVWAMALSAHSLFGIARVVELVDTHV
jgi:hypothetical protein